MFEAAEAACRQYTDNIRQLSARQEEVSAKLEAESRARAEALIAQAQREKAAMERETQARCAAMVENAEKESKMYWDDVSAALNKFLSAHNELRQMLSSVPKGSGNKP